MNIKCCLGHKDEEEQQRSEVATKERATGHRACQDLLREALFIKAKMFAFSTPSECAGEANSQCSSVLYLKEKELKI